MKHRGKGPLVFHFLVSVTAVKSTPCWGQVPLQVSVVSPTLASKETFPVSDGSA